jgi:aryl-phospho-beta-D-glucosidase BglC (GH1 family)
MVDSLIGSDPFASGGMFYLKRILRWAKESSLFAILDLHGAPGSQTIHQSFTGHTVNEAGFFETANYQKAWGCLRNLTIMSHTDDDFSNGELCPLLLTYLLLRTIIFEVVMLQVLNEPLQGTGTGWF